jgi:Cu-Zn family superoxide dismutase
MENSILGFDLMRYANLLKRRIAAWARISGSDEYEGIRGVMLISPAPEGSWVDVFVKGLPEYKPATQTSQPIGPFGFHIHDGQSCSPEGGAEPFSMAMGHFNPENQPHGNHAGDFPVLFSNGGVAQMSFYTDKFSPEQVIGKTVILHLNPDDYRTQPAGNSGKKIACGEIKSA